MIYDNTTNIRTEHQGQSGYAIFANDDPSDAARFELYTDDGKGNGNYVCGSDDVYWIRRIAFSLDYASDIQFNHQGEVL